MTDLFLCVVFAMAVYVVVYQYCYIYVKLFC
jgi:hypothetical protein